MPPIAKQRSKAAAAASVKSVTSATKKPTKKGPPKEKILKLELNNGTKIPLLGLGTWQWKQYNIATGMTLRNPERAVEFALENGYRHIDADEKYQNLEDIGRGLASFLEKWRTRPWV